MASILSAGTTTSTALNMSADTSGVLQLASNNGTVGVTLDTSQNVGIGTSSPNANSKLDVAGLSQSSSASYPAFQLYNSGLASNRYFRIAYDSANNLVFNNVNNAYSSSTEFMRIDSSGNVGIGTSSPTQKLQNSSTASAHIYTSTGNTGTGGYGGGYKFLSYDYTNSGSLDAEIGYYYGGSSIKAYMNFSTKGDSTQGLTERMRIDSSGNLLVGTSTNVTNGGFIVNPLIGSGTYVDVGHPSSAGNGYAYIRFLQNGSIVGQIVQSGTTNVAYNTSSDYRLKNSIEPMTGALAKVAALKPVTYKWKVDGSDGEGFIAHELAEVCPHAVTGEKDAVDADGNPVYQGIDTSFLVATLTAAIQELKAINDQQAETINALTARVVALESKVTK